MLYVSVPTPVEVIVTVPVVTAQVGCVTIAIGAVANAGCAFTTTDFAALMQPAADLIVTEYDPETTKLNILLA